MKGDWNAWRRAHWTVATILLGGALLLGNGAITFAQAPPSQKPGSPQQGGMQSATDEITVRLKGEEQSWPWREFVLTGATLAVAVISLILTHRSNRRTLLQKAYEDEIKNIQERLNSFYGPFRQLLGTSERLYAEFRSHQQDPETFRTLVALLKGKQFVGNDKMLIEQIIEITTKLDELILSRSALISEELQPTLWEASTHFRLIRLAYEGKLAGEPERFERFVYPRVLNDAINTEIDRLRQRLDVLRQLTIG
jgi:hypothetical protein